MQRGNLLPGRMTVGIIGSLPGAGLVKMQDTDHRRAVGLPLKCR